MRFTRLLGALTVLFVTAVPAFAQEYGTPAEAKAMLEKAAAALKADQAKALQMFTKGEGGFREKDLYPYCGGPDGNFTAHPTLVGKSSEGPNGQGHPTEAVGAGSLCGGPAGQGVGSQLHVAAAGRNRACSKGRLRHQSGRSSVRGRLLQAVLIY